MFTYSLETNLYRRTLYKLKSRFFFRVVSSFLCCPEALHFLVKVLFSVFRFRDTLLQKINSLDTSADFLLVKALLGKALIVVVEVRSASPFSVIVSHNYLFNASFFFSLSKWIILQIKSTLRSDWSRWFIKVLYLAVLNMLLISGHS